MPHDKIQWMFVCPNVAFIESPPSINLQQDTKYPHGIIQIISVLTLIQGIDIHFGICTTW
jgi:hypothetical protein